MHLHIVGKLFIFWPLFVPFREIFLFSQLPLKCTMYQIVCPASCYFIFPVFYATVQNSKYQSEFIDGKSIRHLSFPEPCRSGQCLNWTSDNLRKGLNSLIVNVLVSIQNTIFLCYMREEKPKLNKVLYIYNFFFFVIEMWAVVKMSLISFSLPSYLPFFLYFVLLILSLIFFFICSKFAFFFMDADLARVLVFSSSTSFTTFWIKLSAEN